tara:strand:+ start:307 stop:1671 length:1365 start_codon:yes stop_codon:yes gene_type:complete
MNITKKRLHKIKKSNNQSKRNIHKKPNKKNKKNKASNGRKRPHNLKNKTLKIKRGPKQRRKVNVVLKKQLGGKTKEEEGIEVSEKTLWTPSSEEEDETSLNDVDISIEKTLWTPSSEEEDEDEAEDEDEDEVEDEVEDEAEDDTPDESDNKKAEDDEDEDNTTDESKTSISDNDKKEAEKEILLTNLSNNDDWGIFMNALLKTACVIEKKNGEKEEEEEKKVEEKEEKEETKEEEDTGQNGEDNNSMELFNKLSNYYSGKDNNKRDDELYKNAKIYYDIIKLETNDDMYCDSIKFTEGYDNLNAMMEDTDTASKRLNLMVVIHNQVILEKDNIIETILKKKQDKDDETKSQTGGANDILKWFKGFKKDMIKAKYYVEGDVFIPKTNVILKLNFSNEKQLANPDITTQFIKSDQASNNAVGDMMQEIIYSLSNHKEEANKVKTQLEGKRGTKDDE